MPTSVPLEKLTAAANEIDLFKQSYPDAFKAVVNLFRKQRSVGYRNLCRLIMEETTPDIHLRGVCFPYEAALVDVGHVGHSVESVPYNRLILKFAIREPFSKIYNALETRGFIDKDATREVNPDFETYKSEITDFEKKYQSNKYLRNQLSQYDRQGNTINKSEIKFR